MKFLFCTIPEKGHLNPMIGPAVHLQELGHEVVFFADERVAAALRKVGLENFVFHPMPQEETPVARGEIFAERVRDPVWLRQWIKDLLVDQAEACIPAFREAIRATRPDRLVVDPMLYAAIIAAHCEGVDWVVLSNSLNPVLPDDLDSELLQTVRSLSGARDSLFVRYGMQLQFRGCDAISPTLTVAFTTAEFVGREVPGVAMPGPSLPPGLRGDEPDFPWAWLDARRPLIYMSLGSQIYHQPRMLEKLIAAVTGKPVQLLLSAGELASSFPARVLPENVIAVPYAPQLAVLARTSVMITHGGANSVMEALSFGVPLLCTPICNDQFHQAWFVRHSGVGLELNLNAASVAEIDSALQDLLTSAHYREQAQRVAKSYAGNGARRAAELVAQAC